MPERRSHLHRLVRACVVAALSGLCALPLSAQDARTSSSGAGLGGPKEMSRELEVDNSPRERAYRLPIRLTEGWYAWKAGVTERTGIQFNVNYNAAYTTASAAIEDGDPTWAASGFLEMSAGWTLLGSESGNTGTLFVKLGDRHSIGSDRVPMFLGLATGYYGLPATGFGEYTFRTVELHWTQSLMDQRLQFAVGKLDPTNYFNFHGLIVPWRHFMGYGSSVSGTVNWPDPGWGAVFSIRPTEQLYIMAGLHDPKGDELQDGSFFDAGEVIWDGDLFKAVEVGWVPTFAERYFKKISLMYWQADAYETDAGTTSAAGEGWAASAHWFFNETWAPYLRYAWSDGMGFNAFYDRQLQVGVGRLARNYDMLGLSASWSAVNIPDADDQYTLEAFYRFVRSLHFEITPNLQFVGQPTLNVNEDWMTYFSIRTRMTF